MNKYKLLCGIAACFSGSAAMAQPLVFSDSLDTTNGSNYMKFQVTLGANPTPAQDSEAFFGFDFGAAYPWDAAINGTITYTGGASLNTTIPAHPGSGSKKGLMIRVNKTQIDNPAGANNVSTDAINIVPKLKLAGDYRVEVDTWFQVQRSGTSTQLCLIGGNHSLTNGWFDGWSGSGYTMGIVGDGTSSTSYRFYRGATQERQILLPLANNPAYVATNTLTTNASNQLSGTNVTNPYYLNGLTVAGGFRYAGCIGARWVRLILKKTGNIVETSIQDLDQTTGATLGAPLKINSCDVTTNIVNTTAGGTIAPTAFNDGGVWVGMIDPASSPRPIDYPLFTIYKNLNVYGTLKADTSTGTFELGDWTGSYPATLPVEALDSSDAVISTVNVALRTNDTTGKQDYFMDLPAGTASIRAQFGTGLKQKLSVSGTGPFTKNFKLVNGDADADNAVTILDYLALSAFYELDSSAANWLDVDPVSNASPKSCDFDGDNSVSILDYLILSNNYELNGD